MKKRTLALKMIFMLIVSFITTGIVTAQNDNKTKKHKINVNELVNETQQMSEDADKMQLVWWIPVEYWETVLYSDGQVATNEADMIIDMIKPYTMVVVVDGDIGMFGNIDYVEKDEIIKSLKLTDAKGEDYKPIPEDELNQDTKSLLSIMKPILSNMLGGLGENMHFFLFPGTNKRNKPLIEATQEGHFIVQLSENKYFWRLPLGSLLPPKYDPDTGEELNGSWKYSPWTGKKLLDNPPPKKK